MQTVKRAGGKGDASVDGYLEQAGQDQVRTPGVDVTRQSDTPPLRKHGAFPEGNCACRNLTGMPRLENKRT